MGPGAEEDCFSHVLGTGRDLECIRGIVNLSVEGEWRAFEFQKETDNKQRVVQGQNRVYRQTKDQEENVEESDPRYLGRREVTGVQKPFSTHCSFSAIQLDIFEYPLLKIKKYYM